MPARSRRVVMALAIGLLAGACSAGSGATSAGTVVAGDVGALGAQASPDAAAALQADGLPDLGAAREFVGIDAWLQNPDDIGEVADLHGKVTVVQIWTFSCRNCKRTLPNLVQLAAVHADDPNFGIVGIHSPEFDFEKDPGAVDEAARELGVTWPIALDTEHATFRSWQDGSRKFWPRTYVIDQDGTIRFDHVGEGAYDELNATVAALLTDRATSADGEGAT